MNFAAANSIDFNRDFYINTPYPEIKVRSLPFEIVVKLKRLYAGSKSEMTSIMQYVYQHNIFSSVPALSNLSRALEEISVKEMQHYELLSRIMVGANIDPRNCVYIDGNIDVCDYWKASSVDYTKDIIKMLESNILLEQKAVVEYAELMSMTDNENLKEIIERIIQDEKTHIYYFESVLQALKN